MRRAPAIAPKFVGGWVRSISNNVHHSFARRLANSGVTVAEWIVLRMIHECGPTVSSSDIAFQTGLSRGAVSKLVDRAHDKQLVVRATSKHDRRYQDIHLTAKAKRMIPELTKLGEETDDEFFSCLTESEQKTFLRLLKKIAIKNRIYELRET